LRLVRHRSAIRTKARYRVAVWKSVSGIGARTVILVCAADATAIL
jgi:hypothetical protein